jgi:hypothetical protein
MVRQVSARIPEPFTTPQARTVLDQTSQGAIPFPSTLRNVVRYPEPPLHVPSFCRATPSYGRQDIWGSLGRAMGSDESQD